MFATIRGVRAHYRLRGLSKRPALVLIHGFPFSLGLWKPQMGALSRLYRVLSYDLRGMGLSALGPAPQPLESYVDDLFALLDHLGLRSVALCGLSMGGYIALRAAEREPGRFWALALCDTKADADGDAAKLSRAAGIHALRTGGVGSFVRAMLPRLLSPGTLKRRPSVATGLLALMRRNGPDGLANALSAMAGRTDTRAVLRRYPGPLLAMTGRLDTLIPPGFARAMARAAARGRFASVPGAAHASNWESPGSFNRLLIRFLRDAAEGLPAGRVRETA